MAVAKVPYVIDYLKEILIEKKKVVVWAHHHEVIDAIREAFGAAATGSSVMTVLRLTIELSGVLVEHFLFGHAACKPG